MNDINKFYENTKNAMPHDNVKKFIQMQKNARKAIDIGCGMGRDTIFLIKNNWNVIAIDRENVKEKIEQNLQEEELKKLEFRHQRFEKMELEKNNLVVANFSIPFCNKDIFAEVWNKIVNSILKDRLFCGKFFRYK